MPGEKVDGAALAAVAAGGVFLFAGLKGFSIPATLKDIISGQSPAAQAQVTPVSGNVAASSSGNLGTGTGAQLAALAMNYVGHCYSFGGAPGPNGTGCWDCSSFMNWVIGHDAGLAIPFYKAGGYNGTSHGPPTTTWIVWTGCTTIPAGAAQAGDLVVGPTHMGMVTTSGSYISAHDPAEGTTVSPVSTFPDPLKLYRRLQAVETADTSPGQTLPDVIAHVSSGG